ncbi:helix-turn-helix domain-containing protein [Streptomyces sp. NPDC046832]|uniref:nSTAND1 domain-containing NTPase n=1 Tax=Streptomyces sp. NPDC046832 TaxID=3155020 RepID=UPI0033CAF9E0
MQRFAFELRKLRTEAGGLTYRVLAQRAGYGVTTLSQAASGEQLPTLPVVLAYVAACGGDPAEWEARWKQAVDDAAAVSSEDEEEGGTPPYRGLARFEAGDLRWFFGRDNLTSDLLELVRRRRLAVVFGASGSGKSSLLRAGLIPALQHTQDAALRPAAIRILSPGQYPARRHAPVLGIGPGTDSAQSDVFVIVDQFEEVFTLCHDPAERAAFIDLLITARQPESRLRVLLAVRADFYGRCAEHPGLADVMRDANLLVGPMSPTQLRAAIVKPAAAEGLTVERALTARLVEEVTDAPGGLPLLSHVLLETWRRRRGKTMTLAGYEAAGGLEGAVAQTAENVYRRFTKTQAAAAHRLLLRLVAPGDGTPDTHRPADREELQAKGLPNLTGTQESETDHVLEAFARARLLTLDGDTVELAHEALLTAWPRLRCWIAQDRERLRAHRRMTEAARAWEALGRDAGALYRGSRLAIAQEHFGDAPTGDLTGLEHDFLTASTTALEQEQRSAIRTTRRLRRLRAGLSLMMVLVIVAGAIAWQQSESEKRERVRAEARRIAALADSLRATEPTTAMRLSTASWNLADLPETRSALMGALAQREQDAFTDPSADPAALRYLSGDGRTLVSVGAERVVEWDVRTHRRTAVRRGLNGEVKNAGMMSPDARTLTVLRDDRTRLWDLAEGHAASRPLPASDGAEFGPSGRTLVLYVAEGPDDVIQVRDRSGRRVLLERRLRAAQYRDDRARTTIPISGWNQQRWLRQRRFSLYPHPDAVISADDRLVALCVPGGQLEIWNVREQRRLPTPWAPDATADNCLEEDFQFTPDSRQLALRGAMGVRMWNIESGQQLPTINHTGLREIQFSADGRFLVASTGDEILLWRVDTPGRPVFRHALAGESASELRLDLDERRLRYLAGRSGTVVRSLALDSVLRQRWYSEAAVAAAFSSDGATLATAYRNVDHARIRVGLTDTRNGRRIADPPSAACPKHRHGIRSILPCTALLTFSPDGRILAYSPTDHYFIDGPKAITRAWLWDIPAHRTKTSFRLAHPQDPVGLDEAPGQVNAITFNNDATSLLVSRIADGETVRIWDVQSRIMTKETAGIGGEVLALHPNGHLLATSHGQFLDLRSRKVTRHALSQDETTALAFSPDGRYLAAGDSSGRVTLWNSLASHLLGVLSPPAAAGLENDAEKVSAVAFSHDGRTLATADNSGALRLWDTASSQPIGSALPTSGGALLALAFSLDDTILYAAGEHVPLQAFTITPEKVVAAVCRRAGTLTPADWKTYIRHVPYRQTC